MAKTNTIPLSWAGATPAPIGLGAWVWLGTMGSRGLEPRFQALFSNIVFKHRFQATFSTQTSISSIVLKHRFQTSFLKHHFQTSFQTSSSEFDFKHCFQASLPNTVFKHRFQTSFAGIVFQTSFFKHRFS